jgi:hypothetical protein
LQENSFNDPSHDTVLHHGAAPMLSRDNAKDYRATLEEMTPAGYSIM